MKNKEYWDSRAEQRILYAESIAAKAQSAISKAYNSSLSNLQGELNSFYVKYAKENQLTPEEAMARLNSSEKKAFFDRSQEYLDRIVELGADVDPAMLKKYKAELSLLSGKAAVTRMQELISKIQNELTIANVKSDLALGKALTECFEESYYHNIYDIQQGLGLRYSFTELGKDALKQAVAEPWLGHNYSDRIWKNKKALVAKLSTVIPQQMVRGRGLKQVSDELSKELGVSKFNCRRLIRTEVNHVANKASFEGYKSCPGLNKFQFLATLDLRTSDICASMDSKVFEIKEGVEGVNIPPLHPHCRSTTIPFFSESLVDSRIGRVDGFSKDLPSDMDYTEWCKKYTPQSFSEKKLKKL